MNSSTVSNLNASNTIDQNASFAATYKHAITNSAGTKGFIPLGQYAAMNTQNDLQFTESIGSEAKASRSVVQKPPSAEQRANSHRISHFILKQSLKESF